MKKFFRKLSVWISCFSEFCLHMEEFVLDKYFLIATFLKFSFCCSYKGIFKSEVRKMESLQRLNLKQLYFD